MYDFDLWGNTEETKLTETLSTLGKRLIQLEQDIYITTQILEDKKFIDKYRIDRANHELKLNKLILERKGLIKLKRKYEKELANLVAINELEDVVNQNLKKLT